MVGGIRLAEITPTVLLVREGDELRQQAQVRVSNSGSAAEAVVCVTAGGTRAETAVSIPATGDSSHTVAVPELPSAGEAVFEVLIDGVEADRRVLPWQPVPHLRVHVVQHSHHDVGYTNLASSVLREHCRFLDEAVDFAAATAAYPEEARFRLVIEQAWSLQEFVRRAPAERVGSMAALLQSGDVELTALFGNMATELCGPEQLARALYPAARLARRFGVSLVSAEHNDVPGMSWGLTQVLTEAGIRLFCPQLPRYWSWCDPPLQGFWDESALFPHGLPGGFWWQGPSGRRLLLWDPSGVGGDVRPDLPGLADRLLGLLQRGYPYEAVYWPVRGGARDNSPYIRDFCDSVRDWNERYAFPRLSVSTNARFYADLASRLPEDLPVFRGELPGQDYPVGSMSTAAATAVNRNNHVQLLTAERLQTLADLAAPAPASDDAVALNEAYEDTLWYDEHTWGHHFPCGPAATASEYEKQVHAYRAAAVAHDVTSRALARLADRVQLPGEGLYLVVFNPLPQTRTAAAVAPLREIENCGSVMVSVREQADEAGYLRGVALTDRWHLHPPAEVVRGDFELIETESGAVVPYDITEVEPESPVPYAPQRSGLAGGGKRYGFFETPAGLARDLRFVAADLPPCGYRTYELRPLAATRPEDRPCHPGERGAATVGPEPVSRRSGALVIENEFYRLEADGKSGRLVSLRDLELDRELLDPAAPHALGELVVRGPEGALEPETVTAVRAREGTVYSELEFTAQAPGHPLVRRTLGLYAGLKRVELAARILKDPTPLLDAHLAFPFALSQPRFRYESLLSLQAPLEDYLPGAYWDELAVQNWVRVSSDETSLLLSPLDSPMVSLGRLSAGYTSPAHSCLVTERLKHPPAGPEQLDRAHLYSLVAYNNLGTNFAVSQEGSLLFRYSFTSAAAFSEAEAAHAGWEAVCPCETVFTDHGAPARVGGLARLPLSHGLLRLEGDCLVLLALKQAEDGEGLILRLWNPTDQTAETRVSLEAVTPRSVTLASITEGETSDAICDASLESDGALAVRLRPYALATLRVQ